MMLNNSNLASVCETVTRDTLSSTHINEVVPIFHVSTDFTCGTCRHNTCILTWKLSYTSSNYFELNEKNVFTRILMQNANKLSITTFIFYSRTMCVQLLYREIHSI